MCCACRRPRPNAGRSRSSCRATTNTGIRRSRRAIPARRFFPRQRPVSVTNGFPDSFAHRYSFADELLRDSATEGRVITAEFPHLYVVTVYTPNAKDDLSRLALRHQSLGSGVPCVLPAARAAQAGHFLRRSERRAYRARSGESQIESRQEGFHGRGAAGISESARRRLRRHVSPVQAGQRPLHLVEPVRQFARPQRRMENRLRARVARAARRRASRRPSMPMCWAAITAR